MLATALSAGDYVLLGVAGFIAGAVNAVAGGGSLISYPSLLVTGYSPLVANITNTVALVPGYLGGVIGYRSHLKGQWARVRFLSIVAGLGGLAGAYLLVISDPHLFEALVPWLILIAVGLFAFQKPLTRAILGRSGARDRLRSPAHIAAEYLTAIYGAYFGGGLGVMLLSVQGAFLSDDLQTANAIKSVLSLVINGVAVAYFVVAAPVAWRAVPVMLVTSLLGGQVGAGVAKRLPDTVLRGFVIATGTAAAVRLLLS